MKTLLSTAALAALLVSGAALADGPGMNGQGKYGQGMSGPRADMQHQMQSRMRDDDGQHPGNRAGREYAGKGKNERNSTPGIGQNGRGHADDHDNGYDDDHGRRHLNKMVRDHS